MRNLVVLNRSSEKQVIIRSILRHSGEINHAGTGELADESIKKPSEMSIFVKSNNVFWSVKCYIRNSFGQHVSCVDLVKSDGKDDFLNFFMTQIQYFYHFSWFIV